MCPACAARAASTLSQPENDVARTPAADSCSSSRRLRFGLNMGMGLRGSSLVSVQGGWSLRNPPFRSKVGSEDSTHPTGKLLMIRHKLTRIQQRPQDVAIGPRRIAVL